MEENLKLDECQQLSIEIMFYQKVDRNPEQFAIEYGSQTMSYFELDQKSNQIAQMILERGLKKGRLIGIFVNNRIELITTMLGVLKSGHIFVPFDTTQPKKRVEHIFDKLDFDLIFTDEVNQDLIDQICIDQTKQADILLAKESCDQHNDSNLVTRPEIIHHPDDPVYIYFTSGSTGDAKGILGKYQSLLHFILWEIETFQIGEGFKVSQFITPSFDAFLRDVFVPLCAGGTICIPKNREIILTSQDLVDWVERAQVNLIHCVPSLFKLLNRHDLLPKQFANLKYILMSGERIHPGDLENWYQIFGEKINLINLYGPSETTMVKTCYWIQPSDLKRGFIPIGKPLPGTELLLINEEGELCSTEEIGEIYIQTPYRTLGYFQNLEETAKKFIQNPLSDNPQDIVYRTGDLGRILHDGNLQFLERIDHQVKIHGVRVELHEIENCLRKVPGVKEVVVVDFEEKGTIFLAAFLVTEKPLDLEQVRTNLQEYLPEYMIPAFFTELDKLPLTLNGKVDRKMLPKPERKVFRKEYIAPRNPVEAKLAEIWGEVLQIDQIGIQDSFFAMGGHSLNGGFLTSRINQEFEIHFPLKVLFQQPTIAQVAEYIQNAKKDRPLKIQVVERAEMYPASSAQKRLFAVKELEGESTTYNLPEMLFIEGKLNRNRFANAVHKLAERHGALRTSFLMKDGELYQKIDPVSKLQMKYTKAQEIQLDDIATNFVQPFDLTQAPLSRVELVQIENDRHLLMFDLHHSIADGTSTGIFMKDLLALYFGEELKELEVEYWDFTAWQNQFYQSEIYKTQENYWLNTFAGNVPVLDMPTDYRRQSVKGLSGAVYSFEIPEELVEEVHQLSTQKGVTLFMTLFATYNLLLAKYSHQEDLVVGTGLAGRPLPELKSLVGMFVNTLAVRNRPEGNKRFIDFLFEVKENLLEAYEYQEYPFEDLIDQLGLKRDLSRNPLFDTVFVMQNSDILDIKRDGLNFSSYIYDKQTAKFDLTVNAYERSGGVRFELEYSTDLFKRSTIEQLAKHYIQILHEVVRNSEQLLSEIQFLSLEEKKQLVEEFNTSAKSKPWNQTIVELFEEQVIKDPEQIAVQYGHTLLTYREVNQRANQVASFLIEKGIQSGEIIGIMVERSLEMIPGLLGILKARAAYLPIDPSYPETRIAFMLEDSQARLLLTESHLLDRVLDFKGEKVDLTDPRIDQCDNDNPNHNCLPTDLAYVVYTSGTTGKPKGNLTKHQNILRVVKDTNYIEIKSEDKNLQLSNYAFDGSVFDIYGALLNGATLVMVDQDTMLETKKLAEFIETNKITLFFVTTALFNTLVDLNISCLKKVRKILFGGERVSVQHVKRALQVLGPDRLIHVYGPTETTVYATYYPVNEIDPKVETIPIGAPITNTRIYILNQDQDLQPVGVAGEICIGGEGLSNGYLNRPDLTNEKFVTDPFLPGEKMYRTGDLGRWLPDGNIEFIGRIDHQVKIRGFRIELGEIESQLNQYASIHEAVVVARKDVDGNHSIYAYYCSAEEIAVTELREYLSKELPQYMIPAYYIALTEMPLTSNGKIDLNALPLPEGNIQTGIGYVAPETEIEIKLVEIWSEVLRVKKIGIDDHFFSLGGHSLKGTYIASRVYKELNVELPLREIFNHPTIRELAYHIKNSEKRGYPEIIPIPAKDYYPVSSAQKRLIVMNQLEPDSLAYNVPFVWTVQGNLDLEKLNQVFKRLIQRHEALRTSFSTVDQQSVQIVHTEVDFAIQVLEVSENSLDQSIHEFFQPFDLNKAPLMRIGIAESEEGPVLILDMHHIISDGVTIDILIREMGQLYDGQVLSDLEIQYRDFASWQNQLLVSDQMKKQEALWLNTFDGEIPALNLPSDHPRPTTKSFSGSVLNTEIDEELTQQLNLLALDHNVTLYMVMLAAFHILLARYSGQDDIVIGTPMVGRPLAELERIVGMFVNTLTIRNKLNKEESLAKFLQDVKETVLSAYENQDYQFEMLVEKLGLQREMSRNPLFDVMLAFENANDSFEVDLSDIRLTPYHFDIGIAKFDLLLFIYEKGHGLHFELQYSTDLFTEKTVQRMMGHFIQLLHSMTEKSDQKITQLSMLSDLEKDQILFTFNDTMQEYPMGKPLHRMFEEQVRKTSERIAVELGGSYLTYQELNEKANQLARVLSKQGVGQETVVGLMLERSLDMVVSLLAILKAGGAYLPIDPDYPKDRIQHMLTNAGAKILLTNSQVVDDLGFTTLYNLESNPIEPVLAQPRGHIKEFDQLPIPDRSYIDFGKYKNKIGMASVTNSIGLQTTRGCPYLCVYCHKVWSKKHVFRSAENMYQEIEYYYRRGVTNFSILDDCFNLNRENSERLFKLIVKNKLDIQIFFPNGLRGDLLTPDYIDLMVEAGIVNINLSLETASPRLQKLVKKHLDLEKFRTVMEYIATKHPQVILELATMHGFPTETEEEALSTLNFIKDIKWIHFPYIHILKVFPNTEMEELALANGVLKEDIMRSVNRAYHELPETLPFPKSFTRQYQANFLDEYFLNQERLKHVLPVQMKIINREALIQKYNAYLPIEVKEIQDILDFAGMSVQDLPVIGAKKEIAAPLKIVTPQNQRPSGQQQLTGEARTIFDLPPIERKNDAHGKKILLLDLSQHFSSESMLYKVAEQPLGLLYLMTYLKEQFADAIDGRIYKAGIDFDSYAELREIVEEYQPDLIGIRTLSFYKEFFHQTVSLLRQWGIKAPIITGGPYGTSEYHTILKDPNVDLVVFGEGEYTMAELVEKMLENDFKIPNEEVLREIQGISYRSEVSQLEQSICQIILLDEFGEMLSREEKGNLEFKTSEEDLAYVMYTSGTTGKPKGIMVEHRSVNNCIHWMQDEFNLDQNAVVIQRTNLTFDPSVWEIFWPLGLGAKVKLLSDDQGKDAEYLIRLLREEQELTMMYCPASLVTGMTYLLKSSTETDRLRLPWLLIGAEPISVEAVNDFYQYFDGQIVNTYGPTECTINNTYCYLNADEYQDIIPIGKPVANNQIYILSKDLEVQPVKVPGEIYVAGNSLARGYIRNPDKTSEVFISNPFGSGKLYKTGDLGMWLENGQVQIMGRVDDQIKIRGYRIELGEIESAMADHSAIREHVVIVRDTKEDQAEIQTCKLCGVTTAYPDVRVNQDGVCNVCENFGSYKKVINDYFKTLTDLDRLVQSQENESEYDCLFLYSGGRGAAYALYQLVERGYRVLTATYDNGYFAKSDMENIQRVTRELGLDHIVLTHPRTDEILCASLESASTVCKGCFLISSSLAIDYAKAHRIPVMVGATLSRGQIIENKLYGQLKQGIVDQEQLAVELANLQRMTYQMTEEISQHIEIDCLKDGTVYDQVAVIDFYRYCDVTNEEMIQYLNERDSYWQSRKDYSAYSTNCPLKQVGDLCHMEEKGYHYYGNATSWEKRLGHLTLKNLEADLKIHITQNALDNFTGRIGYIRKKSEETMDTRYLCGYFVANEEIELATIREYLSQKLPSYMVPSYLMQVDEIPLTSNGKIDKKALPQPDGNFSAAEYVAPNNEAEKELAQIWSGVLGTKQVGINDNFFDLGGDSIKAIQILAKCNQKGINITVKDIFAHRTIANLLENVDYEQEKELASQEEVSGEVLCTPIQKWFFELELNQPHFWNQRELFSLRADVDQALLENVFVKLIEHHDALRMGYRFEDGQVVQFNRTMAEVDFKLEFCDLSEVDSLARKEALIHECETIQNHLNLEEDLLIKGTAFDLGEQGKRLLVAIHHLVIDTVSWRILLEDIEELYQSQLQNSLPYKTTSVQVWSEKLIEFAESDDLDYKYWTKIDPTTLSSISTIDLKNNLWKDFKKVKIELNNAQTELLLTEAHQAYNTEINDLLLSVLIMSVSDSMGLNQVLINIEGHGREEIIEDTDLSRTVGWFTTAYPVYLERRDELSETIKYIKESFRMIPAKGIYFGIARYLKKVEELEKLNPQISFNYLGQVDGALSKSEDSSRLLSGCQEDPGRSLHSENQHCFLIDINGVVQDGQLGLTFSYNENVLDQQMIENLANKYYENLLIVLDHCTGQSETIYTVSDFEADQLGQDDFDLIAELYN